MALKASAVYEFSQGVLVKNWDRAREIAHALLIFGNKARGKNHISHSHGRR